MGVVGSHFLSSHFQSTPFLTVLYAHRMPYSENTDYKSRFGYFLSSELKNPNHENAVPHPILYCSAYSIITV